VKIDVKFNGKVIVQTASVPLTSITGAMGVFDFLYPNDTGLELNNLSSKLILLKLTLLLDEVFVFSNLHSGVTTFNRTNSSNTVSFGYKKSKTPMAPVIEVNGTEAVCYPNPDAKRGRHVQLDKRTSMRIEAAKVHTTNQT
jgi:hypothetical protein